VLPTDSRYGAASGSFGALCPVHFHIGEAELDDVLKLPATMDVARARSLFDDLSQRRGTSLTIDASDVQKVSALAIEVLMSAQLQWRSDGIALNVSNVPESVLDTCTGLGLDTVFDGSPDRRDAAEGDTP
jgi:anti-anti-sigma regulatory factor